jgi:hypothetical protein
LERQRILAEYGLGEDLSLLAICLSGGVPICNYRLKEAGNLSVRATAWMVS